MPPALAPRPMSVSPSLNKAFGTTLLNSGALRWSAAYFLIFFYYLSFLDYGLNLWDEGGFADGTLRTFRGEMAMRDFNPIGYLPGRYLYAAWFFDWFGISLHSLRLSVAVFTPLMPLMVYAISRRIMPVGFSLLAGAMMLSAPSMYYNRFFPFFCVLVLFCLVRWLERPRWSRGVVLAAAILLCIPFKMEIAIFSIGLWVVLIPWRHRDLGSIMNKNSSSPLKRGLVIGILLIGTSVLLVYFWRYQVLQKFIEIVFTTHAAWGNPFPALFPFWEFWKTEGPDLMFERVMFYIPLATYALVLVLLGRDRMMGRDTSPSQPVLLAVTGIGICAFGLVVWRAGFDNLVRTLPAFYILAPYLLFRLRDRLLALFVHLEEQISFWAPEKILVHFLVGILPIIFLYEMNFGHGFYVGSVGARLQNTEKLEMKRMSVWTNSYEARWVRRIVEKIELATAPGDAILALPLNPLFYYLTERANPIVHGWILPGMLDEKGQEEVVRQLLVKPPRLVILADFAIDGREDRRFSRYAPIIFIHLKRHFQLWERIGLFEVFLPMGPSKTPYSPKF
ncbi:MAG: hypothetical protein G3M70_04935 [Candidatus Nitronauta litoralis]|uniref:Glycosyltransferase RgtA/B/C/D-like domain-containing protein n=1 Tax=Candidatus Nitronauta litoralis TaxID=2705533 RepID=A0A7T0BUV1_9BACT|nr:MAG: hypothetical protein G3M70_04935 [Candidatus Nitronauta litoralis]